MISQEEFLQLQTKEIYKLVQANGPKTVVFPLNGTRRWFSLEYAHENHTDPVQAYMDIAREASIRIYEMLFNHGINSLIAPVFGSELLGRGPDYMKYIGAGMKLYAEHPDFLVFYEKHNIRVHFYGEYRKQLGNTPYAYLIDIFDELAQKTCNNSGPSIFFGVFGSDATEMIAGFSVEYHQRTGKLPNRREIVEFYYGEYIEKADLFIGFEKPTVFDYPLLALGEESLYFTSAPSLYMSETLLRSILYDHIYLRPIQDPDYLNTPAKDLESMRRFYRTNCNYAFGIGEIRDGVWYAKSNREVG